MTQLQALTIATNIFEKYFPSGLNFATNGKPSQITHPRATPTKEVSQMRFGEQLQFLAALYNKVPSTNTARQGRIFTEAKTVITLLKNNNGFKGVASPYGGENYLNESFVLIGLSLLIKSPLLSKFTSAEQTEIKGYAKTIADSMKTLIMGANGTGTTSGKIVSKNDGDWGNQIPETWAEEYFTGTKNYKIARMSLNSTGAIAGALGAYQLAVGGSTYSNTITALLDAMLAADNYNSTDNTSFFGIGGGPTATRRIFGSSGYNAVVGQAFMLGYRGLAQKAYTAEAATTNKYHNAGVRIANFYQKFMEKNQYTRCDEIHDTKGNPITTANLDDYLNKSGVDKTNKSKCNDLMSADHDQATAYLMSLAWGAPQTFITALEKHVVRTQESNAVAGESALQQIIGAPHGDSRYAATGRVLTGFAAILERGFTTVTDGR